MERNLQHAAEDMVVKNIQTVIEGIRERIETAADAIRSLRGKNDELGQKVRELETANAELAKRIQELENGRTANALDVGERLFYLSADEREALERQIDDLLSRVHSHLR